MSTFEDSTTEKLERIRQEISGSKTRSATGQPDAYDLKENRANLIAGRDRAAYDKWKQVMEYHGFMYLHPQQLDRIVGKKKLIPKELESLGGNVYVEQAHTEPQWRRFGDPRVNILNMNSKWSEAFTPDDLISLFGDDPEVFDNWIKEKDRQRVDREIGVKMLRGR